MVVDSTVVRALAKTAVKGGKQSDGVSRSTQLYKYLEEPRDFLLRQYSTERYRRRYTSLTIPRDTPQVRTYTPDDRETMLADWDEIWERIFLSQDTSPGAYLPPASEAQARLEDMWQKQPARLLRKMYKEARSSDFIEQSADDDDAVAGLVQQLDVRSMFSQPEWVQRQMFVFIVLLNELHQFRKHHLKPEEAFGSRQHLVHGDFENLSQARNDIATLVDVLTQPGGIELIRDQPFPIAGPGGHYRDIDRLHRAYIRPHDEFIRARAPKARGAWIHLDSLLGVYQDALENTEPSEFLALTSASLERRWLSNYLSNSERPQREALAHINNRIEVPKRLIDDSGLFNGYTAAAMTTLRNMNGDLYDKDLTEYGDLSLELVDITVRAAGMQHPRTFALPPGFDPYADNRFLWQVIRHGGCPERLLSGLNSGALMGTGWISLPSILQSSQRTYFWNNDGEWLWHEDGNGGRPEPNTEMMAALVEEIGEVPVFDKDAPYDDPDEREHDSDGNDDDDEGGPSTSGVTGSQSGTGYSTVTDSSATRSYMQSSQSDASSRFTWL